MPLKFEESKGPLRKKYVTQWRECQRLLRKVYVRGKNREWKSKAEDLGVTILDEEGFQGLLENS